ncbi:hypothetical protein [Onishia niordana]|uniref:hypothetical protein n=1 Tax=Onishia niordana TaxID=2508711 RepID=UPI00109FCD21|nr:hypothetical protein [Halomonas niordiana]
MKRLFDFEATPAAIEASGFASHFSFPESAVSKPRPPRDTQLRNALFFTTVAAAIVVGWWLTH